jgi:hypothetical protein
MTTISAVLPLTSADLARFAILRQTLQIHVGDLAECVIVAPGRDVAVIRAAVAGDDFYRVVDERVLLGRDFPRRLLRWQPTNLRRPERRLRAGWFVQQMAKMAACALAPTDLALILDADVFALRDVSIERVTADGTRAWAQLRDHDAHANWYRWSERLLKTKRSGAAYGVTPTVLSSEAMCLLLEHLAEVSGRSGWTSYLLRHAPWTEYTLYYTYLEREGLLERFHEPTTAQVYYDNAMWTAGDLDDLTFVGGDDGPLFSLVQSNLRIPAQDVEARLRTLGVLR